jgi:hypothetical protein
MAIKKSVTTEYGMQVNNAIHRVREVRIEGTNYITFKVKTFVDENQSKSFSNVEYGCAYNIDEKNPLAQAYDYLKTLAEFSNSVDC